MILDDPLAERNASTGALGLTEGPVWRSFEQMRVGGARELDEGLPIGAVGRLQTKEHEYAVLRAETFARLYGLAQEIDRIRRGARLIQQAAQVGAHAVREDADQLAFHHVSDLIAELLALPAEAPAASRPAEAEPTDDAGDASEFELDPTRIKRPSFSRTR